MFYNRKSNISPFGPRLATQEDLSFFESRNRVDETILSSAKKYIKLNEELKKQISLPERYQDKVWIERCKSIMGNLKKYYDIVYVKIH